MLKWTVGLLLTANLGYAAWHQGWIPEGWARLLPPAHPTREPDRWAQQVAPQRLEWLKAETASPPASAPDAAPAPAAPTAPTDATPPAQEANAPESDTCIQVAGLSDKQAGVLRIALLSTQPDGGWVVKAQNQPPRWIVYLGKFGSVAQMSNRKAELRSMGLDFRDVNAPALQPGLALGTYSTEAAAQKAQRELILAGVRSAKVVLERAEAASTTVQWPKASEADRVRVSELLRRLAAEGLDGKQPQPCS